MGWPGGCSALTLIYGLPQKTRKLIDRFWLLDNACSRISGIYGGFSMTRADMESDHGAPIGTSGTHEAAGSVIGVKPWSACCSTDFTRNPELGYEQLAAAHLRAWRARCA